MTVVVSAETLRQQAIVKALKLEFEILMWLESVRFIRKALERKVRLEKAKT